MLVLAVFAHPDDETFGPGGTLVRYALAGHAVHLRTFTRGEAGTLGPARFLSREQLAELRCRELERAVRALHLSSLEIYGLPDGKLRDVADEEGVERIGRELDALNPDVLITFHRDGISGHADHRTVARWCLQAARMRERPPRLLGYGITSEQARRIRFREVFPIPDREITHVIDVSGILEHKLAASRCHASQSELWERIRSVEGSAGPGASREHFSQAWPEMAPRTEPFTSLEEEA